METKNTSQKVYWRVVTATNADNVPNFQPANTMKLSQGCLKTEPLGFQRSEAQRIIVLTGHDLHKVRQPIGHGLLNDYLFKQMKGKKIQELVKFITLKYILITEKKLKMNNNVFHIDINF